MNFVGDFAYNFVLSFKFCDIPDRHHHSLTIRSDVTYSVVCIVCILQGCVYCMMCAVLYSVTIIVLPL